MADWLGDRVEDSTLEVYFTTHDKDGGAVAPSTAFEAADIAIYKNGSATQKATTNGLTMTSPFDSVTGLHLLVIDTSNDTGDAGFWATGARYAVILSPDETVDSETVVRVLAQFSIEQGIAAAIETKVDTIDTNVDSILTDTGTTLPATLSTIEGKVDTVDGNVDDILTDTGTTLPATLSTIEGKVDTVDGIVDDILTDTGTTLDGKLDTIDSNVDAILVDTGTTLDGKLDTIDSNVDAILVDTGTTLPASLATTDGKVDDILTDTGTTLPATLSTIEGKVDTVDGNVDDILTDTGTTLPAQISGLNDVSTAEVNAEVDTALSDIGLDHLLSASVAGADVADDSVVAQLVSKSGTADWNSYDNTTDSLEGIADSGGGGPTAEQIADQVWDEAKSGHTAGGSFGEEVQAHSLSSELATTDGKVDTIDSNVDAILTDTGTTLPATLSTIEGKVDTVDGNVDDILTDTGTTLDGKLDTIDTNVDSILTDTGTTLPATLTTIDGNVDSILTDTNELQGDWTNTGRLDTILDSILADSGELQADWANGGRLDLLVDAIKAVTDNLPDSGALTTIGGNITTIDTVVDAIKLVTDNLPNSGALTDLSTGYRIWGSGGYADNDQFVFHTALYKDSNVQGATACTMDMYLYEGTEVKDTLAWDTGPVETSNNTWYAIITDASTEIVAGKAYLIHCVFTVGGTPHPADFFFNA